MKSDILTIAVSDFMHHMDQSMIMVDQAGLIYQLNSKAETVLELPSHCLKGETIHKMLCAQYKTYAHHKEDCPFNQIQLTTIESEIKTCWIHHSGEYMQIIASVLPVNHPMFSTIVLFKKMIHFYEKLPYIQSQHLINNTPIPLLIINEADLIVYANPYMIQLMTQLSHGSEDIASILPPSIFIQVQHCLKHHVVINNLEIQIKAKWLLWNLFPDLENKVVYLYGLDMTSQKQTELSIRLISKKANKANDTKSLFLAAMSHDIRTPLNAIIGIADLLSISALNQQQQEYLKIINHSADSLLSLIDNILDLSRMEAGELAMNPVVFNIRQLFHDLMDMGKIHADKKMIGLTLGIDPLVPDYVMGDQPRLNQIMMNLLMNAIKFTDQGTVTINVTLSSQTADHITVMIAVADTGIGIPQEKLKSIFKPYVQANNNIKEQYGGYGLGLSICKKLVDLLQGEIKIESQEGKGSVFNVILTFDVVAEVDTAKQSSS